MSKLNFDVTVNSSDFIEKTELVRSAIRATALEMEEQGRKISLSFLQIADNASLTANIIGNAIKDLHKQINDAIVSMAKLDSENQLRLTSLQSNSEKTMKNEVNGTVTKDSAQMEIGSRENLSMDISNQYNELVLLNAELLSYQQQLELFRNELSALRNELALVCSDMEQMRSAGQQNTEVYAALQNKAIELAGAIGKANEQLTNTPVSNDSFEGILSGLNGISGAFSAAAAEMELFSVENETLQNIMGKVQSAIAITNGLQEVNTLLSKKSAFQVNVLGRLKLWWRGIALQAAAAQGIETAAASTGTAVNSGLALSFRAIGLAISSIPVFGWIVAGISALIAVYSMWSSETEEQQKKQEELNKSIRDFNDSVQNNAAKPIAMIELLSIKFKALGNNVEAQRKFIIDNKQIFDELGVSINNLKDAQQLLIDNKDKFIGAQIAKAKSLAYMDKMQEEAKKYIEAKSAADFWQKAGNLLNDKQKYAAKEKSHSDIADKAKEQMDYWGNLAFSSSKESDDLMSGFSTKKKTTGSGKSNNTDQIKEAHNKLMGLLQKQKSERERFIEESKNSIVQAELDAKPDGSDKKRAQMALNHKKELDELESEKQEVLRKRIEEEKAIFDAREKLRKANDSKYEIQEFNVSTVDSNDIDSEFGKRNKLMVQKHSNEKLAFDESEKQAMNELLKEYGTFMEKRAAIIALGENKKKGKGQREQEFIDEDTKKALSNLDTEANRTTSSFGKLFSDVKDRTVNDMRTIAETAQNAYDFVDKGEWDSQKGIEFGMSKETFEVLKQSPEELEKIKNQIKGLNEQADASDTALNKMAIGFEHLFAAGSDPEKLKKALGDIGNAMNEVMQATQFVSDSIASLGEAFGNDTLGGIAEGMNVAMDAAGAAMSGAQAGAAFGPWGAAAGAAIGLVSSLSSSLAKLHDAKNEKNIQRIQEQIEVLEKSYENLGESLDKAFSTDASALIDQQNTLLEQQKVLIRNQISEEQGKKNADEGRIKEWENQIEDIDKVIAGNKEKKIDVIFGEDLKSAIDNFAQAYADAWSAGDDKAKSSRDLVKNMIKQMITEAIKAASSAPMENLRKKLAGYFSDGIISDWERQQIEKDAEAITKDLDQKFGWADEYMKGDEKESTSQDSTKGGFATMSQETGSELNGRFTALQISNEEIKNSMLFVLGNLSSLCTTASDSNILLTEMRNLSIMSNGHLEDIAKHTKVLLGFGNKLDSIDFNTKSLISR